MSPYLSSRAHIKHDDQTAINHPKHYTSLLRGEEKERAKTCTEMSNRMKWVIRPGMNDVMDDSNVKKERRYLEFIW
jgi:hypothetical protein